MFTRAAILACALLAAESGALGAFTIVSNPDSTYRANTTLLPLDTFGPAPVTAIFDAGLTINFSLPGFVTSAPAVWSSWSSSPNSENPGGPSDTVSLIAFSLTGNFVLSFSRPLTTFGVELQPDVLDTAVPVTATFFRGATQVGQVTRSINSTGSPLTGGARLFAGTSLDQPFTSVQLSFDTGAAKTDILGVAYFRYTRAPQTDPIPDAPQTDPIPEPGTVGLIIGGAVALALRRRSS